MLHIIGVIVVLLGRNLLTKCRFCLC